MLQKVQKVQKATLRAVEMWITHKSTIKPRQVESSQARLLFICLTRLRLALVNQEGVLDLLRASVSDLTTSTLSWLCINPVIASLRLLFASLRTLFTKRLI